MKKAYVLRHQVVGIIADVVYLTEPSDDVLAAALVKLPLARQKDGSEKPGWIRAHAVRVSGDSLAACEDYPEPPPAEVSNRESVVELSISAVGTVT
jgi:hypothetical protein